MFAVLVAVAYLPLFEPGWSQSDLLAEEFLAYPEVPYVIPADKSNLLVSYYRTIQDPEVRRKLIQVYNDCGTEPDFKLLISLLEKETDPSLQADLLSALLFVAKRDDMDPAKSPVFKSLLSHPSGSVRAKAAELLILGGAPYTEVEQMLAKEMTSFVPDAVFAALDREAATLNFDAVRKIASETKNVSLRNDMLAHLAKHSPDADQEKLLQDIKERNTQIVVLNALAVNPASPVKILSKYTSDKNINIRLALAGIRPSGKSILPNPPRTRILMDLLKDPSPAVRQKAASSLFLAVPTDNLIDTVAKLLRDPDRLVRKAAGETLAKLSAKTLRESVLSAKSHPGAHLPLMCVIRATGNPQYASIVSEILTDPVNAKKDDVQIDALNTLAVLKEQKTAPVILLFVKSEFATVRAAAARALRYFPGSATVQALKTLIFDPNEDTGIQALDSARVLKDPALAPETGKAIGKFRNSTLYRITAVRAYCSYPEKLDRASLNNVHRLVFTKCIPVPMSPPTYDTAENRAAGVYLLLFGKKAGVKEAEKMYQNALNKFKPGKTGDEEEDPMLLEYVRQFRLIEEGKEVPPTPIEFSEPEYPVYPWKPSEY